MPRRHPQTDEKRNNVVALLAGSVLFLSCFRRSSFVKCGPGLQPHIQNVSVHGPFLKCPFVRSFAGKSRRLWPIYTAALSVFQLDSALLLPTPGLLQGMSDISAIPCSGSENVTARNPLMFRERRRVDGSRVE
jgi:hypothetical protein